MCKVYNTIGSLTTIISRLHQHRITEFKTLEQIIAFQKNYPASRHKVISTHEQLLEQEKRALSIDIPRIEESISTVKATIEQALRLELEALQQQLNHQLSLQPSNFIQSWISFIKRSRVRRKIRNHEINRESKINASIQHDINLYTAKVGRYQYLDKRFADALQESCTIPLNELERIKRIIDDVNTFIYGAIGEQKVAKELEQLSDEYVLINDFNLYFAPAIYHREEGNYIKSIQIDHLLVSPSGIFLIETKNWSKESLNNLSLRSPVEQIKRANYTLFKILGRLHFNHHWGNRKIPIRNLIVLINSKPKEEFQHVKTLTLNETLRYIKYFPPTFSSKETQEIADYLQHITGSTIRIQ